MKAGPQDSSADTSRGPGVWLVPLALIVAGTLVYLNTLGNPFIFDDTPWIVDNPRLKGGTDVYGILTETSRPLLDLTIALNRALGGLAPAGYHLFNLTVHVLACLALYGILRRTLLLPVFKGKFRGKAHWLAGAAALLWVVHPLNTQAVTYVIQRGESMMGLFYLLTLYAFARYAGGGGKRWAVLSVLSCLVGVGAKEVIATAPLLVLLYDRTFIATSWREPFAKRWGVYLCLFATWVPLVFIVTRSLAGEDASAGFALEDKLLSRWTYLLTQAQVIPQVYLYKAFWPNPLVLDYGWMPAIPQDTPSGEVMRLFLTNVLWQGLVVVGLLGASAWGVIKRKWWGFVGAAFFLILAPTSSFVPIADIAVEHRMYLPLACVVVVAVFAGYALLAKLLRDKAPLYGSVLLALLALLLGLGTFTRNVDYRSRVAIWESVADARPYNARGWHNLASALEDEGRHDEAMECFENVLKIVPNYAAAQYGIGTIWLEQGNLDKAIERLQIACELEPNDAASIAQLGRAYMLAVRFDEAQECLARAIEIDPHYGRAYVYQGLIHLALGDAEGAIERFSAGIEAQPDFPDNYQNLAELLAKLGRYDEAVKTMDELLGRADAIKMSEEERMTLFKRRDAYRAQALSAPVER